jgi:hypothetical protein
MYEDHMDRGFLDLDESIKYFREYAKRGLKRFLEGNIEGCLLDMDRAIKYNTTQPLQQRGIILYCVGNYSEAAIQLKLDIKKIEATQLLKASELRLWHSACLYKLDRVNEAKEALDIDNTLNLPVKTQSYLINTTLSFFFGSTPIEDMLEFIGNSDKEDNDQFRFFGNFYIGLYYDSIGDKSFSQMFLSLSKQSNRYPKRDMWYQVPRILYLNRFGEEEKETNENTKENAEQNKPENKSNKRRVNDDGMII